MTDIGTMITARGGTDGANIVLFWPDNLPDDADAVLREDPMELVECLRDEGKIIWFPCDGDGGYSVAVFVRRPIPDDLAVYCTEEERQPTLQVNGEGYFGGMEYLFKQDSSFLNKYPGMCQIVRIPRGVYAARIYSTHVPEEIYESWIIEHAGTRASRLSNIHGLLAACSAAGILAGLVAFFFVSWVVWFGILGVTSVFIIAALGLSKTESCRRAAKAGDDYEQAYPSYVVLLE